MVCGKNFTRKDALKRHMATHVATPEIAKPTKTIPCKLKSCNKCFVRNWHMQRHFEECHGPAKFSCPMCGKTLKTAHGLAYHKANAHN